ncbi:unnamed protein product [Agarophyton chilense]
MTVPLKSQSVKSAEAQPLLPQTSSPTANSTTQAPRQPHATRDEALGMALMAFSTVGYSVMGVLVRLAEQRYGFPPTSSVFLRGNVHILTAVILLATVFDASPMRLTPMQRRLLAFRGFIGACGMLCCYESLNYIPAGEMISIFSFSPVITMGLSHFLLREHVSLLDLLSAVIGLFGVFLIAHPDDSQSASSRVFGCIAAFCGACFASTGYVCVRRMGANVHFMLSVLSLSMCCVIGSFMLGPVHVLSPIFTNATGSFIVLLSSVFAFLGQCCLNKGLQLCRAGPGVLMRNLDVPLVYLLAVVVLNEKPDATRLVGSSLVIVATLMVGVRKILNA